MEKRSCREISFIDRPEGNVIFRRVLVVKPEASFKIAVGTPNYIQELNQYNSSAPEEAKIDNRIYPYEGISIPDLDELCPKLQTLSLDDIRRYAEEDNID